MCGGGACMAEGVHGRETCTAEMGGVCGRGGMHGRGGMCGRGGCMVGGKHGRGHAWQGACVARGWANQRR